MTGGKGVGRMAQRSAVSRENDRDCAHRGKALALTVSKRVPCCGGEAHGSDLGVPQGFLGLSCGAQAEEDIWER